MANFALIGAAGYIAPRHLKAIQETGNVLVAALDKHDAVGILDSYFPEAAFFTEFERFDRYLDKLKRNGVPLNYVSVCSPNYLHDAHIRFGLRLGADVICEKPVALNPWNLKSLQEIERESSRKVYSILQLRHHPALLALREKIKRERTGTIHDVNLTYITSRGNWYYASWKGENSKSGGIATNIGIHFFDLLTWLFGNTVENTVHIHTHDRAAGYLELERAKVRWFLSINADTLPKATKVQGARTYRSISVDGQEIEFSEGFTDLHTVSYQDIISGKGFGLDDAATSVQLVHDIRNASPIGLHGTLHELAKLPLATHPFG